MAHVSAGCRDRAIVPTGWGFEPEFTEPVNNLTVPLGRDAIFTCYVTRLGGHKVKTTTATHPVKSSSRRAVSYASRVAHMSRRLLV